MDQNSNISFQTSSRSRKILNVDTWSSAFIRFTAIYSMKFPLETPQLMKYMEIVRDIATRRPGLGFLYYDTQFRMLRESVLLPWDHLHTEFWLMACNPVQHNTSHPQPFRSPRQTNRPFHAPKPKRFLLNTCWNFNKRSGCPNASCPHTHACGFCRGSHTASNCRSSNKEQSDRTPTKQAHVNKARK